MLSGLSSLLKLFKSKQQLDKPAKSKLGQSLFTLHHQTDLTSVVGNDNGWVTDIVMMNDGRLVKCVPYQCILLICNTDGSQVDIIDVQNGPRCITAVNNSTVAVTLRWGHCIEMYDTNNKLKLKSIPVPGMLLSSGITTINNKLVVRGYKRLQIIDHQTGEVVQKIQADCDPWRVHGSGDRIFYSDLYSNKNNNNLYWYSYTDDRHHTLKLSSHPRSMTTLQDGSMYVVCWDGSLQHVSSDGNKYKTTKTLPSISSCDEMHYNLIQRKLVIIKNNCVEVFNEI
ncbi:PHLPP [Mytilus coruscus]|uniref:PHLPP n=1 Tax=Mytilus coruscus TaxID=42192 RepID=A0A6J8BF19_MYTCO|nr:PHLPP [Mytilus coruscus]